MTHLRDVFGALLILIGVVVFFSAAGLFAAIPSGEGVDLSFWDGVGVAYAVVSIMLGPVLVLVGAYLIVER